MLIFLFIIYYLLGQKTVLHYHIMFQTYWLGVLGNTRGFENLGDGSPNEELVNIGLLLTIGF